MADLRFTRLKLTNWRNFRDAEMLLGSRAFIVGPNASGKSNLLDAIRFLGDLARPIGGGLAAAVAERHGFRAIRCLEARNPSHVEIDAAVGTDEEPARWRYRLKLNTSAKRKPDDQAAVVEEEVHGPDGYRKLRSTEADGEDPEQKRESLLEQTTPNREFRDLADFLRSVRYLHVVPQIVRDSRRHLAADDDPFGGDLIRRIKHTPKKTRDSRLARLQTALQIAVPQFRELKLEDDPDGRPHLLASYKHWRANPTHHDERSFSDGTLRLIGFLWSIMEAGGPLLLEEPELSLHGDILGQLPALIARAQRRKKTMRQVIATTHAPAMLDDKGVALDEVFQVDVESDGAKVSRLFDDHEKRSLMEHGHSAADIVGISAKPNRNEQFALAFS